MPARRINPDRVLTAAERQQRWRHRRRQRQERERLADAADPIWPLIRAWNDTSEADQGRFLDIVYGRIT